MGKTTDIPRFRIAYVPQTLSAKLQRQVLRKAWLGNRVCKVKEQAQRITMAYRRRLDTLAPCWSTVTNRPFNLELLRNCCPSHIVPALQHRTAPCRYRRICPWCHARWVREIWETFEGAMWPDGGQEKSKYSLVWEAPVVNVVYSEQALQTRLKIATNGFKTTNWPDVCGHVAWAQAVPWKSSPESYQVSWRWLGITEDPDPFTTKLCQPTRPVLARVLGRFFQYPVRMIQSEPWQVANVLNAQAGHRLFNRYGLLRASRGSQQEPPVPLCCPPRE